MAKNVFQSHGVDLAGKVALRLQVASLTSAYLWATVYKRGYFVAFAPRSVFSYLAIDV